MTLLTRLSIVTLFLYCVAPIATSVYADRGVGVNLGDIRINDRLARGDSYNLPLLGVINTGNESAQYEVVITHPEDQSKLRPAERWFDVQPQRFFLEPGQVKNVAIRLTLPTGARPGDYAAFIEAHPIANAAGVNVTIAAATTLSFNVKPSSWLDALRVRIERFLEESEPWTYAVPCLILATFALVAFKRSFRIALQRK